MIKKEELLEVIYKIFPVLNSPDEGALFIMPDGKFIKVNFHGELAEWIITYLNLDLDKDDPIEPVEYFNAVRVNDGKTFFIGDYYVELPPKKLTAYQFDSLENWLEYVSLQGYSNVDISVFRKREYKSYDLDDINYIINRIKRYYNTGELKENMNTAKRKFNEEIGKGWSYDDLKAEIKRRRPGYTLDRLEKSRNKEQVAFRELNRIYNQDLERRARKEKQKEDNLSITKANQEIRTNTPYFDYDSGYWKIGDMEFISDTDAYEYLDSLNEALYEIPNINYFHGDEYIEQIFNGFDDNDITFDLTLDLLAKVEKALQVTEQELVIVITDEYVDTEGTEILDSVSAYYHQGRLDEFSYQVNILQKGNIVFGYEVYNGLTQLYFRNEEEAEAFLEPTDENEILTENNLKKKNKKLKTPFINYNAGDPQKGVAIFNSMNNVGGLCEDLHPVPEDYEVLEIPDFNKQVKDLKLTDEDIDELKVELKKRSPKASLGNCVYKFEWWPKRFNLGKKEGRVIYIEYIKGNKVWLVSIYQKNRKKDLTDQEEKDIIKMSRDLKKEN